MQFLPFWDVVGSFTTETLSIPISQSDLFDIQPGVFRWEHRWQVSSVGSLCCHCYTRNCSWHRMSTWKLILSLHSCEVFQPPWDKLTFLLCHSSICSSKKLGSTWKEKWEGTGTQHWLQSFCLLQDRNLVSVFCSAKFAQKECQGARNGFLIISYHCRNSNFLSVCLCVFHILC